MIKKVLNILKSKKIIIIILLIAIIIGVSVFFIIKSIKNSSFYSSESLYADDTKQAQNNIYQDYVKSKAKFYVYGEVLEDSKISMTISCNSKEQTVELSEKSIEVDNHCILSLEPSKYGSTYLTAYIITPDVSLIAVSSYNNPKLQVNAYKKETRIVLENGLIYSRIAEQNNDSIFSIQNANILINSSGGEISSYNQTIDPKSAYDLAYRDYVINGEKILDSIYTNTVYGVAGFQIINGSSSIKKRGGSKDLDLEDYQNFAYYDNEVYLFNSNGTTEFKDDYGVPSDENDNFIKIQEDLNNNEELNFIGIAKHNNTINRDKLDEIMKKYYEYYTNKINNNNDDTSNNNGTNNNVSSNTGCSLWHELTGYTANYICWCRSDNDYSDLSNDINSYGYNLASNDILMCEWGYSDYDASGVLGDTGIIGYNSVVQGPFLKSCALELGWDGTYSNENGSQLGECDVVN